MARILLVGATGLVGRQLLDLLIARGHDVIALTRRATGADPATFKEIIADPAEWPQQAEAAAATLVISCLGTTFAKAGKSEAAFRTVDQHLVLAVMDAAYKGGARHALSISSVGASAASRTFYLRVKGEVENSLDAMRFVRLDVIRPGLLRGERGAEKRVGERIGIILSPLTDLVMSIGPLRRYRSINSTTVAQAMAVLVDAVKPGTFIHDNDAIARLAAG